MTFLNSIQILHWLNEVFTNYLFKSNLLLFYFFNLYRKHKLRFIMTDFSKLASVWLWASPRKKLNLKKLNGDSKQNIKISNFFVNLKINSHLLIIVLFCILITLESFKIYEAIFVDQCFFNNFFIHCFFIFVLAKLIEILISLVQVVNDNLYLSLFCRRIFLSEFLFLWVVLVF